MPRMMCVNGPRVNQIVYVAEVSTAWHIPLNYLEADYLLSRGKEIPYYYRYIVVKTWLEFDREVFVT